MVHDPLTLAEMNARPAPAPRAVSSETVMRTLARATAGARAARSETFGASEAWSVLTTVYGVLDRHAPRHARTVLSEEHRAHDRALVLGAQQEAAALWSVCARFVRSAVSSRRATRAVGTPRVLPTTYAAYRRVVAQAHPEIARRLGHAQPCLSDGARRALVLQFLKAVQAALAKGQQRSQEIGTDPLQQERRTNGRLQKTRVRTEREGGEAAHHALAFLPRPTDAARVQAFTLRVGGALRSRKRPSLRDVRRDPCCQGQHLPHARALATSTGHTSRSHRTLTFGWVGTRPQFAWDLDRGVCVLRMGAGRQAHVVLPDAQLARVRAFLAVREIADVREVQLSQDPHTLSLTLRVLVRGAVPGRDGLSAQVLPKRVAIVDLGQRCPVTLTVFDVTTAQAQAHTPRLPRATAPTDSDALRQKLERRAGKALQFTPVHIAQWDGAELAAHRAQAAQARAALEAHALSPTRFPLDNLPALRARLDRLERQIRSEHSRILRQVRVTLQEQQVATLLVGAPAYLGRSSAQRSRALRTAPHSFSTHAPDWAHADMLHALLTQATRMGLHVLPTDESHTSTHCPQCGTSHALPQHTSVVCTTCGFRAPDRDVAATLALASQYGTLQLPKDRPVALPPSLRPLTALVPRFAHVDSVPRVMHHAARATRTQLSAEWTIRNAQWECTSTPVAVQTTPALPRLSYRETLAPTIAAQVPRSQNRPALPRLGLHHTVPTDQDGLWTDFVEAPQPSTPVSQRAPRCAQKHAPRRSTRLRASQTKQTPRTTPPAARALPEVAWKAPVRPASPRRHLATRPLPHS